MDNIQLLITPTLEAYLIGLTYRNTRTSCLVLAQLCARFSHDSLRRVLYLAVLLHDTGKRLEGDHSITGAAIAREVAPRLGFTPTETEAYNERCREIAREMFYIMSEVRGKMDDAAGTLEHVAQVVRGRGRGSDRVHGADFHSRCEYAQRQRRIAVDHELRLVPRNGVAAALRDAYMQKGIAGAIRQLHKTEPLLGIVPLDGGADGRT